MPRCQKKKSWRAVLKAHGYTLEEAFRLSKDMAEKRLREEWIHEAAKRVWKPLAERQGKAIAQSLPGSQPSRRSAILRERVNYDENIRTEVDLLLQHLDGDVDVQIDEPKKTSADDDEGIDSADDMEIATSDDDNPTYTDPRDRKAVMMDVDSCSEDAWEADEAEASNSDEEGSVRSAVASVVDDPNELQDLLDTTMCDASDEEEDDEPYAEEDELESGEEDAEEESSEEDAEEESSDED